MQVVKYKEPIATFKYRLRDSWGIFRLRLLWCDLSIATYYGWVNFRNRSKFLENTKNNLHASFQNWKENRKNKKNQRQKAKFSDKEEQEYLMRLQNHFEMIREEVDELLVIPMPKGHSLLELTKKQGEYLLNFPEEKREEEMARLFRSIDEEKNSEYNIDEETRREVAKVFQKIKKNK